MKAVSALVAMVLVFPACTVLAGPPLYGEYFDNLEGRYTVSYVGDVWLSLGNTYHAESWDEGASALGLLWEFACPALEGEPEWIGSWFDEDGNGYASYLLRYSGGTFWLSGAGPWGNEETEYTGILDYYTERRAVHFWHGLPFRIETQGVECAGDFDEFDVRLCAEWDAMNVGVSDGQVPDYPVLLESPGGVCSPNPTLRGEYGRVECVVLRISDEEGPTRAKNATWGSIKSTYR
ncbi:MAG: hypothetical protein KAW17_03400 [Candidatus Eisenbacteria sp.]|nr:hypothetical protein [Candidatus Eisenbacteria bacterium]